jgi:hypothetical protein
MINHNTYSWGDWSSDLPSSSSPKFTDKYSVKFNPPKSIVENFRIEMQKFAMDVYNSTNKPIALMLSGGLDSEVMAHALMDKKIPFKAFTCEFTDDSNAHDTHYAYKFCKKYSIPQTTILIDPIEFIRKQYRLPIENQFAGIAVALIYELAKSLCDQEYFVLTSQGSEFRLERSQFEFMSDNDRIHHLLNGNYSNFTTSEIMQSIAFDPVVRENYYDGMNKAQAIKVRNKMYHHYYPELEERTKYDGWEYVLGVKEYCEYAFKNLKNQSFAINYDEYILNNIG